MKNQFFLRIISLFFICVGLSVSFECKAQNADTPPEKMKYAGIGISVEIDSSRSLPYIVEVLSDKPGALAGLRSGDHILKINHWKTYHKNKMQVANHLRGSSGSKIVLKIDRAGKEMVFEMKRQKMVLEQEPANFCEGIDMMIRAGSDTFKNLKGKMLNEPIGKNEVPNYQWESKLKLRKFTQSLVVKNFDREAFFRGVYFIGKDSIQAVHLFDNLVSDISSCLPYTCVESFQQTSSSDVSGFTTTFVISQIKPQVPDRIKGSTLTIHYLRTAKNLFEVNLEYRLKR